MKNTMRTRIADTGITTEFPAPAEGQYTFEELTDAVQGSLQTLPTNDGRVCVINASCYLNGMEPNPAASKIFEQAVGSLDGGLINGPVLFLPLEEIPERFMGVDGRGINGIYEHSARKRFPVEPYATGEEAIVAVQTILNRVLAGDHVDHDMKQQLMRAAETMMRADIMDDDQLEVFLERHEAVEEALAARMSGGRV